jgi:hypothetical protein
VFHEQQGPDGVSAEGVEALPGVDVGEGFFGVQDARDGEGEAGVGFWRREEGFGVGGCGGDAGFALVGGVWAS